MTLTVKALRVLTAISNISITGISILDITDIPDNGVIPLKTLYPNARINGGIISPMSLKRTGFGSAGTETAEDRYGLNYRYICSDPKGNVGNIYQALPIVLADYKTIKEALMVNDTVDGCQDLWIQSISDIPVIVHDIAGHPYWGFDIQLGVWEFSEKS